MTNLVVITGLSGSGKTLGLRSLEDLGYFAVDNLPLALVEPFVDLLDRGTTEEPNGAFVADVRELKHHEASPEILRRLRERSDVSLTIIFLEARESTLVRRFSESRRPHPLAASGELGLVEAIRREIEVLAEVRSMADRVIATDRMSPHDLRRLIQETVSGGRPETQLRCELVSFGFKYGVPREADIMFDVRFLPNPYFQPSLRAMSGLEPEVIEFLQMLPDYPPFMDHVKGLLSFVMPRFVAEGKSYLTVAIGCTGGRHRSVAIANELAGFLQKSGFEATVRHRDLTREADRSGA
ncbi:MAG: RNase adapter RapZ [Acidobacteria bacterium]|nr:RNase adapter RapZ [Acidobacteriota bacterium]